MFTCAGKPYGLGWRVYPEERQSCEGSPECTGELLHHHTLNAIYPIN